MNKNKFIKLGVGITSALLLVACSPDSNTSNKAVLEIGDYSLTQDEFYKELRDTPYSGDFTFGEVILEQKIIKQIFEDKYGSEVTKKMVDEELDTVIASYPDEEQFDKMLEIEGSTREDVREDIRMTLLTMEAFKEYEPLDDEELKDTYENMLPSGMTVRHIFVEDEAIINEVKEKLDAGEDFADLVDEYSEDEGSRENGGEYELVRDMFVEEFEEASLELELDEVSDIVESDFGFHIIQLIDEGKELTYEETLPKLQADKYEELKFSNPGAYEGVIAKVLEEYKDEVIIHEESIKDLVQRIINSVELEVEDETYEPEESIDMTEEFDETEYEDIDEAESETEEE